MYGIDDNGIVDGLGKPTIKFEFDTNDELKRFLNDNKENLIENYVDVDYTESNESTDTKQGKQKSLKGCLRGLGKPPADIFNVPENQLKTFGFSPTYERLTDYSHLIDTADNTDQLTGYGFDGATLKTLVNVCQRYRHQVAKLADHLKADTPDQSAFNIWHWLHCNVKYNYDTAGKEEIRTPARTWADRKRGVDCDCLSVFTACLLLNMGYSPKFEIVAFSNKPQYSHIFVNLNGMAIDRVLPMFNRRPSLISKTMFMDIPVYQLSGVDDTEIMNGLNGLYSSTLSKIAAGTASKKDRLNFRKTQVLVTLQGTDYNAFRLAGLLMPYVSDIDEMGNYYFDNENVADVAVAGENELVAAELRGADEYTLGKLFKKIGKALKKAAKSTVKAVKKVAKSTGKAVKAVAKTTGKAVKTVAKQTAKVTKAAVKSAANAVKATANVVKAGAQAAAGKGKAAKATLKKAGTQVKKTVVQPVKTVAKATKEIVKKAVVQPVKTAVKVTVINPTKKVVKGTVKAVKTVAKTAAKVVKKTLKIAGKVFKVIFVKLNPATVLMRNSLRLLVALNFVGMATKLNVANMTKDQAIKDGYTAKMWDDAKKAKDRVIKFFTKLGGKKANIEKAIVNGAKKKALFKKDYKPTSKIVETGNDNATLSGTESPIITGIDGLGAAVTIGSALASVGAFIGKIWKWIANIAKTAGKAVAKATVKTGQAVAKATKKTGQAIATATKKTGQAVAKATKKTGQAIATATKKTGQAIATAAKKTGALVKKVADKMPDGVKQTVKDEENLPQEQLPQSITKKSNLPLILGISAGVLTIGAIAYSMSKKKSKAA